MLERKKAKWGYLFIAPNFIGFILFTLVPVVASLVISLSSWDIVTTIRFVGFRNYVDLFQDKVFVKSLLNTLLYTLYTVPAGIVLALLAAVMLNKNKRSFHLYRTIFFLPTVTSMVAISLVWSLLYNKDAGLINYTLKALGIPAVGWLVDTKIALLSVAIVAVWKGIGYNMTIYTAGLQGIPRSLYEAATIDGATGVQAFFKITLPLLAPTTYFITMMSMIGALQVFDSVYVLTNGGPANATKTVVMYLYENGFKYLKMGYASAMAYVLFIMIFALSILQSKFSAAVNDFEY